MSDLPILYSFRRCPYAMRARMALCASGTAFEIREITLRNKPDAMIAASPKGTVPVLVLPNGNVIDQSIDIMHWALGQNDPQGWMDHADHALIARNDGPFKHHLDRYKYHTRYDCNPMPHRNAAMLLLSQLDQRLAEQSNLSGDAHSLTDFAIMPFVRQFAATDRDWFAAQPVHHLITWLKRYEESDLFGKIMMRLAPWKASDNAIIFT